MKKQIFKTHNQLSNEAKDLQEQVKSLKKAIQEKHLDCCIGSRSEVTKCTCTVCPIYHLR